MMMMMMMILDLDAKMQKKSILSKTKQFRAMISIDDLYRKLYNWAFQRTHYWIPKI